MSKEINKIVFATQKGGVGKSTVATLLASYMYFKHDHGVAVIDADHPQHSIQQLRSLEARAVQQDESIQRAFARTGKRSTYTITNSTMSNVFGSPGDGTPSTFAKISVPQLGIDTVIIDTPGSVAVDGLGSIISKVNRVVIPLEPEQMSLISSGQFMAAILPILRNRPDAKLVAFWNKIRIQSHADLMADQNEVFRAQGIEVLDNYIPESVKMKRDDTRSTILPANYRSLDIANFMEELYQAVK